MRITVKVHPNSKHQKIVKISEDSFDIYLTKPSIDNKANIELIKLLKKHFKRSAKIIHGITSKNKIVGVN